MVFQLIQFIYKKGPPRKPTARWKTFESRLTVNQRIQRMTVEFHQLRTIPIIAGNTGTFQCCNKPRLYAGDQK
jgi:hypothetical protein